MFGGSSFGLFALAGGAVAGIGVWLTADQAIHYKLPSLKIGPISIPGRPIGGTYVEAGIERRSKLPGIILDRMLIFILSAASWAHGKRENGMQSTANESVPKAQGIFNTWNKQDQLKIMTAIEVLHRLTEGKKIQTNIVEAVKKEFRHTILRNLKKQTMEKNHNEG